MLVLVAAAPMFIPTGPLIAQSSLWRFVRVVLTRVATLVLITATVVIVVMRGSLGVRHEEFHSVEVCSVL